MYPNSHLIKIPLEISQMLSTVWRELTGLESEVIYKSTHSRHPCTLWLKESYANFKYAIDLFYALHDEWNYRYGHNKTHKCFDVIEYVSNIDKLLFKKQEPTPFALAMDIEFKSSDAVKSYRTYFNNRKLHLAQWKNRNIPSWVNIKEII